MTLKSGHQKWYKQAKLTLKLITFMVSKTINTGTIITVVRKSWPHGCKVVGQGSFASLNSHCCYFVTFVYKILWYITAALMTPVTWLVSLAHIKWLKVNRNPDHPTCFSHVVNRLYYNVESPFQTKNNHRIFICPYL